MWIRHQGAVGLSPFEPSVWLSNHQPQRQTGFRRPSGRFAASQALNQPQLQAENRNELPRRNEFQLGPTYIGSDWRGFGRHCISNVERLLSSSHPKSTYRHPTTQKWLANKTKEGWRQVHLELQRLLCEPHNHSLFCVRDVVYVQQSHLSMPNVN